jgi:hypothetical protein
VLATWNDKLTAFVDEECEFNLRDEIDVMVREAKLTLLVQRLEQPGAVMDHAEVVLTICGQIRIAMDKKMRIFCAKLLTSMQGLSDSLIALLMQKEEFTSQQRFTHVNTQSKKIKHRKDKNLSGGDATIQGILLLLLEDDSMAVRLASIQSMSIFAVRCGLIR